MCYSLKSILNQGGYKTNLYTSPHLLSYTERYVFEDKEINEEDLIEVLQFLKSNDKCKFKQLIDIVGVDYPEHEKRFQLIYLLLSHENNLRIKIKIQFHIDQKINSITKLEVLIAGNANCNGPLPYTSPATLDHL